MRGIGKPGRLTGGAWVLADDGKTHHQVQLGCTAAEGGRLTAKGKTGTFELTSVDYALCVDDTSSIVVRNAAGTVVLTESGALGGGNHQAHAG